MTKAQKVLQVAGVYFALIFLTIACVWWQETLIYARTLSPFQETLNYLTTIYGNGVLVVIVGFLLAITWAMVKKPHQPGAAKAYFSLSIATILLSFLVIMFIINPLGYTDCGDNCAAYIVPRNLATPLAVASGVFWLVVSYAIYKYMNWAARK